MTKFDDTIGDSQDAPSISRRRFLAQSGAAAASAALLGGTPLAFAATHRAQTIQFGLHQITWGSHLETFLRDTHDLGFPGAEVIVKNLQAEGYYDKPAVVKAMLANFGLFPVSLSSGGALESTDPDKRAAQIDRQMQHAQFCHDVGIMDLQLVASRNRKYTPVLDDYKRSGELMTEIGRRAIALGVKTSLHNHMGSLCQSPEQLDLLMANSDPKYLYLELDIAHCTAGGGNPAKTIDQYHDRLLFIHAKDLLPGYTNEKWRFVELGQGIVDIRGAFAALERHHFKGWAVVELDKEEIDPNRTPKQSAEISKRYIKNVLKLNPILRLG